ncbi:MAG: hypothetical protein JNL82_38930 [Myxococcales bacterium]|nr:hypothetical protein [Myxococcales bacterium]
MRHVRLRRPIAGLWALGLGATAAAVSLGVGLNEVRLALFAATLLVEILALVFVLRGRAHLQPSDEGRRTWTLLAAALTARLLAELRVGLLYLDAVPGFIADRPALMNLFVYVLRYLYTLADLLLLAGLWTARRSFDRSGLGYPLRRRDLGALALLAPLPLLVWLAQDAMQVSADPGIFTFRLVSVVVGSVVSALCLGLASTSLQMGGGVLAWIWGGLATAGIARVFAFVAASGLQALGWASVSVVEQGFLWTFACAWLLAAGLHWRLCRA